MAHVAASCWIAPGVGTAAAAAIFVTMRKSHSESDGHREEALPRDREEGTGHHYGVCTLELSHAQRFPTSTL